MDSPFNFDRRFLHNATVVRMTISQFKTTSTEARPETHNASPVGDAIAGFALNSIAVSPATAAVSATSPATAAATAAWPLFAFPGDIDIQGATAHILAV